MDPDTWEQIWAGIFGSWSYELSLGSLFALLDHDLGTEKGDDLRYQLRKSIMTDDLSHLRKWLVERYDNAIRICRRYLVMCESNRWPQDSGFVGWIGKLEAKKRKA